MLDLDLSELAVLGFAYSDCQRIGLDHVPYLHSTLLPRPSCHTPKLQESRTSRVVTTIFWNIWKAHNSIVFHREHLTVTQVLRAIIADLQLWCLQAMLCNNLSHQYKCSGRLLAFLFKKKNSALLADLILNKLQIVGKNIVEAIEQVRWIGLIFLF